MDRGVIILWLVIILVGLSIGILLARRSLVAMRFCVKCDCLTTHRRDYGVGLFLSQIVAFLNLGWQTMTDQYYPFRCTVCGTAYQEPSATERIHELGLDINPQDGAFGNWAGTGGVQGWAALKWHQKLLMLLMIGTGIALFILYWLARMR